MSVSPLRTCLPALLAEVAAGILITIVGGEAGAGLGLLLHGVAAVLAGIWFVRAAGHRGRLTWRVLSFPVAIGFGVAPAGILFLLGYFPLTRLIRGRVTERSPYEVFERRTISAYRRSPQQAEAASAVPLVEVIRNGAADARLRAVIALRRAKLNPRSATRLLREALDTGIHELEIIASTSLAEMEEEIDQVLGELIKNAEESSLAADYNAVARQFHEYGYMGLAEGGLRDFYLETAIGCFEHSLSIDPEQPDVRIELVRYLIESRRFDEAVKQFDEAVASGYAKPKGYFYLAEVYYLRKEWNDLITLCQWLDQQRVAAHSIQEICTLWSKLCVPTYA